MKAAAALLLLATLSFAQEAKRPKITAIDHVDFYTTGPRQERSSIQ